MSSVNQDTERESAIEDLARTVALGLHDARERAHVIRAMRGSPFNERKLDLQTFLDTPAGRALVEEAEARGGLTRADIDEALGSFPEGLDFYVSSDAQRRAWVGNGDILVGGVERVDAAEAVAFDADGHSHRITTVDLPGYAAVFSIHPAEPRIEATRQQSDTGESIEDAQLAEVVDGSANQICPDPETCGGGGGGGGSGGGGSGTGDAFTMVNRIYPDFHDGVLGGDLELKFVVANVNDEFDTNTTPIFSAVPEQLNIVHVHLHDESANTGLNPLTLSATLMEDDNQIPGGGDDYKGESLPDIAGSGGYDSWDPFLQRSWGTYNVVVGCFDEPYCE